MILQIKGADYSQTGLGKLPYVSDEVRILLELYPSITEKDRQNVQKLINDAGDAFDKSFYVILPILSANTRQAISNFKTGAIGLTSADFQNDVYTNARYFMDSDKTLNSNSLADFGDNSINQTLPTYSASGSFAVRNVAKSSTNLLTDLGSGNINISPSGSVVCQKYDGTNNQRADVVTPASSIRYNTTSFSGQVGNTSGTVNKLYVDSAVGDFDIVGLTGNSKMSLGHKLTSEGLPLLKVAAAIYCQGLTTAETLQLHNALKDFISKY